jgi:hypothetical protein
MKHLALILSIIAGVVGVVFYLAHLGEPRLHDYETATVEEHRPMSITMLASDDKKDWIQAAANEFGRKRPDIDLNVQVMSSIDGLNAILSRQITPILWSPSESLDLDYLQYRWTKEFGTKLFETDGEDAPRSLARSPIVWLSWRTRVDALNAAIAAGKIKPEEVWAQIACAGVPIKADGTWTPAAARWDQLDLFKNLPANPDAAPAKMSAWNEILFHHTDPTHSSAGFGAIYMMAYGFPDRPLQLGLPQNRGSYADSEDLGLRQEPFQTWFRRCQRIRRDFPASLETLTRRLSQFGPDNYDIVVTYENLALQNMLTFNNRWSEQPYLFYPPVSIWADHPIVILNSAQMQRDQRDAARDWIAFLLAPERQRALIGFGLRPLNQRLLLREQRTDNPFVSEAKFNAQVEPKIDSPRPPTGAAIDLLLEIWRRATGYY